MKAIHNISSIILILIIAFVGNLEASNAISPLIEEENLNSYIKTYDQDNLSLLLKNIDASTTHWNTICNDNFSSVEDKISAIEQLVDLHIKAYNLTQQDEYLNKAFIYVELNKSETLSSKLKDPSLDEALSKRNQSKPEQVTDIKEVQDILSTDQAVIEYFVGKHNIYAIIIEKGDIRTLSIKRTADFDQLISDLRTSIIDHYAINSFADRAFSLYSMLFQPLGQLPERLIIIPDGTLSYIPFEVLLTEKPQNPATYKSFQYLIKDHSISYAFSATLLLTLNQKTVEVPDKSSNYYLAFAPSFQDDGISDSKTQAYNSLKYNSSELFQNLPGKKFIGSEATKHKFQELAKDYKVLHIATHGKIDEEAPQNSFIAFSNINQSKEESILYLKELHDMQLDADLVVLSACETGVGKIAEGEGVFSLARAFTKAGSKSVVSTLWSVNDQTTAQLISNFYSQLSAGSTKDEALRHSKLQFIQNSKNNLEAHPYYWAGLIITGNDQALDIENYIFPSRVSYSFLNLFFIALALVATLFWSLKKLSTQTT